MNQLSEYLPPAGFKDYEYEDAYAQDFVLSSISNYFYKCGYNKLKFPTLERQHFFSSEFVGSHPWPNFHPKSLFSVTAKDYDKTYEEITNPDEKYFLIPEGTTSLCRWVAGKVYKGDKDFKNGNPIKIFYTPRCFRNELISELSETKLREFTQIGAEYLGVQGIKADIETIQLLIHSLKQIGITRDRIRVRINDVRFFNHLASKCGLNINKQNIIKNHLDTIASHRAKAQTIEMTEQVRKLEKYLVSLKLNTAEYAMWKDLYGRYLDSNELSQNMNQFPQKPVKDLVRILKFFEKLGYQVVADLSVTRSQEYYNKVTFQADVLNGAVMVTEVAGGGRYDNFINKILETRSKKPLLYATGFAFSLERIMKVLKDGKVLNRKNILSSIYNDKFDYVIFSKNLQNASKVAENLRQLDLRVDNYIASSDSNKASMYAKKINAELLTIS